MMEEKNKLFSEEEIENIFDLYPDMINQIKSKVKNLIVRYPIQSIGLAFAFGILLGVSSSTGNQKK